MKSQGRNIFIAWLAAVLALLLYSFTQIDLGLTLTRASYWQPIQKAFQQIGYFQRPLSTLLFLLILFFLFGLYFLILNNTELWIFPMIRCWVLCIGLIGFILMDQVG